MEFEASFLEEIEVFALLAGVIDELSLWDLNLIAAHLAYTDFHETFFFYILSNEIQIFPFLYQATVYLLN